jgi:SET domain-containing protein
MLYHHGGTSGQELVLAPVNLCNFGPLLNHSEKGNYSSLRIIIDGSIRVLLYTTRKVAKGEELLYNYNGFYDEYPTDDFGQHKLWS